VTNKNGAVSRAMPIAPEQVEQPDEVQPYLTASVLSFGKQLVSNTHKGQKVIGLNGLATQLQRGVTSCRRSNKRTSARMSIGH
jgi:hypothetical protein